MGVWEDGGPGCRPVTLIGGGKWGEERRQMKVDVESGCTTPHSHSSVLSVLGNTPFVTPPISIESPAGTNMVPHNGHPMKKETSRFHFSPFPSISLLPSSAPSSSQPARRIVETMVVDLILIAVAVEWGFTSSKKFSNHLFSAPKNSEIWGPS